MIEEPPILSIVKERAQPTQAQIDSLQRYPTGFLVDAMRGQGALDASIKPLYLPSQFKVLCGPVLTCDNGPADVLATMAALTQLRKGEVLMVATGAWSGCAAVGDRVMGMLRNAGAVGLITDGLARDIEGIREVGLPIYATGLSPNSPYCSGPGSVGTTIQFGTMAVSTGDVVVADENGAVIVPFNQIDRVLDALKQVEKLETELDAEVNQGLIAPKAIQELIKSDRVEWI